MVELERESRILGREPVEAFAALDAEKQNGLRTDLRSLITRLNKADDGTMVVPGEYLEAVIVKR